MVKRIFRSHATWIVSMGALVMALAMGVSYLGAFLSPEAHMEAFPLGIVNEDEGIVVAGQPQNRGDEVLARITVSSDVRIEWIEYGSRDELLAAMRENDIYGGMVITDGFTRHLAGIVLPGAMGEEPSAAVLELVYNEGGGSLAGAQGQQILRAAAAEVDSAARTEILAGLEGRQVDPAMVTLIADPVQVQETVAVPAPANTGHGMGSFYIAVVTVVGAFLAADVVSIGVDFVTGHTSMGPRLTRLRGEPVPASLWAMYRAKLALFLAVSVLASTTLTWFITGPMGTPVSDSWVLLGVLLLAQVAIGALTLLLITVFSLPGILIGLVATTILGVPSAMGVFPAQLMPPFYRAMGDVLPVRYLSDAVRALIYFDGNGDAGLTRGVVVLALYAAASLVLGALASWWISSRRGELPSTT